MAVVWLMGAAIIIQQHWHIEFTPAARRGTLGDFEMIQPGPVGTILCMRASGELFWGSPDQCKAEARHVLCMNTRGELTWELPDECRR
jgi:hypothetical protein